MSNDQRIMGIDELAEYLKMSRSTLYKLSQEGKIPCQKFGRHWRYNREFIDEWAKGNMGEDKSKEHGAQLESPSPSGETEHQNNDDLKRYFSVRQVRLLDNCAIHSVSDVLLSLATVKGKNNLVETLKITPEKLDVIATRITKDLQSHRTGGTP